MPLIADQLFFSSDQTPRLQRAKCKLLNYIHKFFLRHAVFKSLLERKGSATAAIHYEYQAVYPKGIEVKFIAKLNREFMKARTS